MNSHLSKKELKIINNIKIGCEELIKLILSDILKSPEKFAKLDSHKKHKYFVRIFVIHEILRIINNNGNKSFRPIDIRKQLPDNYKDIRYSSLSDIMNSMVKMKFLIRSSGLDIRNIADTLLRIILQIIPVFRVINHIIQFLLYLKVNRKY